MSETPATKTATADAPSQSSKLSKKKVNFDKVDVYFFEIKEGIDAVPTTGGIPLGMEAKHHDRKEYSCNQFEKLHIANSERHLTSTARAQSEAAADTVTGDAVTVGSEAIATTAVAAGSDPTSPKLCEHLYEPLSHEARMAFFFDNNLPFDQEAIKESLSITESREVCGCKCRFGNCMGNYCSCSANGIECQAEEDEGFPCACQRNRCKNPQGRREFNRARIREHFLSTVADLIMAQKREQNAEPKK